MARFVSRQMPTPAQISERLNTAISLPSVSGRPSREGEASVARIKVADRPVLETQSRKRVCAAADTGK
ncbi:MAG TPA: hypothetical protein VMO47_05150 [Rhodothermales bacterium]|nr:hypothetical protein [Rhodothermales bacterium]